MQFVKWLCFGSSILFFSLQSSATYSQNESGLRFASSYYENCKVFRQWSEVKKSRARFSQCAAYALGVVDTFRMYAIHDENTTPFCIPDSVNTYRLLMEVIDGMEAQHDQLEVDTALMMMMVVRNRFPCELSE